MSPKSRTSSSRKGKETAIQNDGYDEQYDVSSAGTTGSCYASSSTTTGPGSSTGYEETHETAPAPKSKPIRSEGEITLQGPLDVVGSVRAGGNIIFNGDFDVRDKVEAYGAIEVNGNLACDGKMKAYGNIQVAGYMYVGAKLKGFGKLKVMGTCEVKDLEVYGNTTINGFLKCKRMILYGSLTLVGQHSGYHVEEEEKIWGTVLSQEEDVDW